MPTPDRMYDTVRWRKVRLAFLRRDPLCALCIRLGRVTRATIVDHIMPHGGNPALFWDEANLQSLCASCHSGTKRIAEAHGRSQACDVNGEPLDSGW